MSILATLLFALTINVVDHHAHADVEIDVLRRLAERPTAARTIGGRS